MPLNPYVERRQLVGLKSDLNRRADARWFRTSFLWLHSFLTSHRNPATRVSGRGEVGASRPALTIDTE